VGQRAACSSTIVFSLRAHLHHHHSPTTCPSLTHVYHCPSRHRLAHRLTAVYTLPALRLACSSTCTITRLQPTRPTLTHVYHCPSVTVLLTVSPLSTRCSPSHLAAVHSLPAVCPACSSTCTISRLQPTILSSNTHACVPLPVSSPSCSPFHNCPLVAHLYLSFRRRPLAARRLSCLFIHMHHLSSTTHYPLV